MIGRVEQSWYGNSQLKISPITMEGICKCGCQKKTNREEHLYDNANHHSVFRADKFQACE